jgi:hypothetical protein
MEEVGEALEQGGGTLMGGGGGGVKRKRKERRGEERTGSCALGLSRVWEMVVS